MDEIQRQPELLSYLQVIVDQKAQNGLFYLTCSHQLVLKAPCHNTLIYAGEGGMTIQDVKLLNYQKAFEAQEHY